MIVYLARDIPTFVMYCIYGESGSSLLVESTDLMIVLRFNQITMDIGLTEDKLACFSTDFRRKCIFEGYFTMVLSPSIVRQIIFILTG